MYRVCDQELRISWSDQLTDSKTFKKYVLSRSMTCHPVRFGFSDVYDAIHFFCNVLTKIHQHFSRRTIEVAWLSLGATNNETKRDSGHSGAKRILPHSIRSREILVF